MEWVVRITAEEGGITITLRQESRWLFCGVVSGFGILLFIAKSFELQSRGEEEVGK